jgi:NAD(P)-dependent dehydrogenase (short-subunit alcohol dehydrogenase family)
MFKVYKNPRTGEVVETKGGNHNQLKEWKAEHASMMRVAKLRAAGFEAEGRAVDLTQETQVTEFVAWAETVWGRIDILVNNAGVAMQGSPEPFAEFTNTSLETWNLSIARNWTGTWK